MLESLYNIITIPHRLPYSKQVQLQYTKHLNSAKNYVIEIFIVARTALIIKIAADGDKSAEEDPQMEVLPGNSEA